MKVGLRKRTVDSHSSVRIYYKIMGQSHDFWRAYSLFVARVASFALERNYMPDKSHLIIIIINTKGHSCLSPSFDLKKKLIFHFEKRNP